MGLRRSRLPRHLQSRGKYDSVCVQLGVWVDLERVFIQQDGGVFQKPRSLLPARHEAEFGACRHVCLSVVFSSVLQHTNLGAIALFGIGCWEGVFLRSTDRLSLLWCLPSYHWVSLFSPFSGGVFSRLPPPKS